MRALLICTILAKFCCASFTYLITGIPLHHTLGSPTRSLDEVYERLNDLPFAAEFKYDGQRAQIHVSKSAADAIHVKIFSRHLEDMTDKVSHLSQEYMTSADQAYESQYPDVVSLMRTIFEGNLELQSAIFDSEIVAIDPTNGELKTFQELSARPRKDVHLDDIKVPICVFAFDLMYFNGKVNASDPTSGPNVSVTADSYPQSPEFAGGAFPSSP